MIDINVLFKLYRYHEPFGRTVLADIDTDSISLFKSFSLINKYLKHIFSRVNCNLIQLN